MWKTIKVTGTDVNLNYDIENSATYTFPNSLIRHYTGGASYNVVKMATLNMLFDAGFDVQLLLYPNQQPNAINPVLSRSAVIRSGNTPIAFEMKTYTPYI